LVLALQILILAAEFSSRDPSSDALRALAAARKGIHSH